MIIMRVVKSPRTEKPFYLKVAYFIGYTAYYVREVFISVWFRIIVALAVLYGIMKLARVSIEIVRAGDVLPRIK